MSEQIKHECGLAFIRLRKPLDHYIKKYGTAFYGVGKLQLLMQKQRNRGQDGAGIVSVKLDPLPGKSYIHRERTNKSNYIKVLFGEIYKNHNSLSKKKLKNADYLKNNVPFVAEVLMGHLRYGTHGSNSIKNVHPVIRKNNWKTRNLALAGNFNLTNVNELFDELISYGQHPNKRSDTITILEKIGHFLDTEVQEKFEKFKNKFSDSTVITQMISKELDVAHILKRASKSFDGGYTMGGIIGNGDAFIFRDPSGIRPAFYYYDDEFVVAASERPAIQTTFDVKVDQIHELGRGNALIVKNDGWVEEVEIKKPLENKACSFERIYFSRGTDRDIYLERKKLGKLLTNRVMDAIDHDLENTIFSFIPNTAEVAFYGLMQGIDDALNIQKTEQILKGKRTLSKADVENIMKTKVRVEKLVVKDAKMRTFISDTNTRGELVSHVYDVTYGIVRDNKDTLVLIDDSIVRGTTLKDSIISIISRLNPKKIIILSSAPQIRYPDCYGIDMSKMNEFVAFRALLNLLKRDDKEHLMFETYEKCKTSEKNARVDQPLVNHVQSLYNEYTEEEISAEIARIVTPDFVEIPVEVIYQSVENLNKAMPGYTGDWYFSGNFPTDGGTRVVNRSFINFMENKDERAY
jgi:amidophosphoribosyltransferase